MVSCTASIKGAPLAVNKVIGLGGVLQAADAAAASAPQQPETYEIDQWILDFAQLFRESLNIEPDRHLDLTNMGWDKLQARMLPGVIIAQCRWEREHHSAHTLPSIGQGIQI